MAAGATEEQLDALGRYGDAVGLAFQIADDLLNETSTAQALGKAVGSDRERGKMTYATLFDLEEARGRADALVREAVGALDPLGPEADPLRALAHYIAERAS